MEFKQRGMSQMLISVVVTTYNGEKYIGKQLDSLLQQTRKPDEVFIVDDCSSDSTIDIVERFTADNDLDSWHLIRNKENLGYKRNFHKGIQMASGDIIFLSDQDDEWLPEKIEIMSEVMRENPQIEALNCAVQLIDGDSNPIKAENRRNHYNCNFLYSKEKLGRISHFTFPYILEHNISPGCTMAFTNGLRDKFLATYYFRLPHDWHLNLLAAADYGCCFLNEPLIRYRRHGSNQIGVNTGAVKGIKSRTREMRIAGCVDKLETCRDMIDYFDRSGGVSSVGFIAA